MLIPENKAEEIEIFRHIFQSLYGGVEVENNGGFGVSYHGIYSRKAVII